MATTQLDIKGVFDTTTGLLTGFASPAAPEIPLTSLTAGSKAVGSSIGFPRIVSMGSQAVPGGANGSRADWVGKIPAEAPFSWVRVWHFSKEPVNESSGWEVIVAPTDEPLNDNRTNGCYPMVNGTSYNVYADTADKTNAANAFGWRRVQYGGSKYAGGASKSGILRAASRSIAHSNQYGYFGSVTCMVSDRVAVKSVPANDGSGLHYLLYRAKKASTQGETVAFWNQYATAWKSASALPWYRRMYETTNGSDGIANLTSVTPNPTEASFGFNPSGVFFEFGFDMPVRTVVGLGDSVTEGGGLQQYGVNNWVIQAAYGRSKPSIEPFMPFNAGLSTNTQGSFLSQIMQMYANGFRPTDVVIPDLSLNSMSEYGANQTFSRQTAAEVIATNTYTLDEIRRNGGQPYIYTNFYNIGLNDNSELQKAGKMINDWAKSVCSSGIAKLVDVRGNWAGPGVLDDGVHPRQAGIDRMAELLAAQL